MPEVPWACRTIGRLALSGALVGLAGCGQQSRSTDTGSQGGGAGSGQGGGAGSGQGEVSGGASGSATGDVSGAGGAAGATGGLPVGATAGRGGSSPASGGAGEGATAGSSQGGVSGAIGIAELVGTLDGRLIQLPSSDSASSNDNSTLGVVVDGTLVRCLDNRLEIRLDHTIGGTPGATYLATMHFYGILEPRDYGPNVERESGSTPPANLDSGAAPPPWAFAEPGVEIGSSGYNTYEIRVIDEAMNEVGVYFVNSDTRQGHYTYVINYERTIPVIGGGIVRVAMVDADCRFMKNCGTGGAPCEGKARTIDLLAADPPPPPDFKQPKVGGGAYAGQWWMIDVTRVEAL